MSVHKQVTDQPFDLITPNRYGGILVVTTNDIPGYDIVEVHGTVYGITVRSRDIGANMGASFKTLVGGELKSLTKNIILSRDQAVDRMVSGARDLGANAISAFRFDSGGGGIAGGIAEICCYGTACTVKPRDRLL